LDAGVFGLDGCCRVVQRLLAHVERHEASKRSRGAQRVEQDPRLLRCSRAELDERLGLCDARDLRRPVDQDPPLAPSRVVLVEPGDLIEQLRAPIVVEPLRRYVLGARGEPRADVVFDRAHVAYASTTTSRARRTPPNIQRLAGGKKFRYVKRVWPGGVSR